MKKVLDKLALIPEKIVDLFNAFLDGVIKQVSTAGGTLAFAIILLVFADVWFGGVGGGESAGVLNFALTQVKEILVVLSDAAWQVFAVAIIIVLAIKNK